MKLLPRSIHHALLDACLTVIVWGTLAFGAVYPWAHVPLAIACGAIGVTALVVERRGHPPVVGLAVGLTAIGVAIALQLVPLPLPALARVSPGTDTFLIQYDLAYQFARWGDPSGEPVPGAAPRVLHAVSIAPVKTARAAMLFAGFALFFLGTSRVLSVLGAKTLSRLLIAFGIVLAVGGIVQRGLTATDLRPAIYGFWRPRFESNPFGPFVNPNHFAGWMLMVLPLAFAAFLDALLQAIESRPRRGRRIGVLSSPEFGLALAIGAACLVMGLSLLMTGSRSGLAAFVIGSMLTAGILSRRQASRPTKAAVTASVLALLLGAVMWSGLDAIVDKFTQSEGPKSLVSRVGAWKDTVQIIRHFPLTGAGLDTYGTAMILYQTQNRLVHFQEAHNDYLQLAAEGGLLVGIPALATLTVFVRAVRRRFREAPKAGSTYCLRIGAVAGLISIALQSLVDFSLQMPANAALCAVLAAIAAHQSPSLAVLRRPATR